jgi:uncharacterized OB-fold protein
MSTTHYVDGWPQPYRLPDAEPYWRALQEHHLQYQRCTSCQLTVWPAHSYCPHCGVKSLVWLESSGRGKVYSFSTVMRGPTPAWQAIVPYTVGFVQMDEGYFLFTQIEGKPEAIAIGQPVRARFVKRGEQVLPVFAHEE